ncbi:hypothetical protein B2_22 [Stenotrophomonas phage B2]|nr:hypothetical protein B2_22 [Stenotrophomonas phage B2]
MTALSKPLAWAIAGTVVALAAVGVLRYGSTQYDRGYQDRHAIAEAADRIRERTAFQAKQEEQAKADAAAIEHENLKTKSADLERSLTDARRRLQQYSAAKPASACPGPAADSSGSTDPAPDWIGVFGACLAEYDLLARDAAKVADTLRPLQRVLTP